MKTAVQEKNFIESVGMELIGFKDEMYLVKLEVTPRHFNMMGFVHGGVLTTLLDTALARSFFFSLPEGEQNGATLEMKVNFLKAVKGGVLTAFGHVVHTTRQTALVEGGIRDEAGNLIARASATIMRIVAKQQ